MAAAANNRAPVARRRARSRKRRPRRDADQPDALRRGGTREQLLDIAGQVFAEKGFDRATSKEICARAGANVAAINYHFGSFDRLYVEVLCEAHRRLATVESLRLAVSRAGMSPQAKLAAVIRLIVSALTGPVSHSWVVRVLGREIVSPSPAISILREQEARPKLEVVHRVVAELMQLPKNHPSVARGALSVMGPCFVLLVADRRSLKRVFPNLQVGPGDAEALVTHLVRFALAGLAAVSPAKADSPQ